MTLTYISSDRLLDVLVGLGLVSREVADRAIEYSTDLGESIENVLVSLGHIERDEVIRYLAEANNLEHFEMSDVVRYFRIERPKLNADLSFLEKRGWVVLPIDSKERGYGLLTSDPTNTEAIVYADFMSFDYPVKCCSEGVLSAVLSLLHNEGTLSEIDQGDVSKIREMASEAPVINLCNQLFSSALRTGSSDLHIEPLEKGYKARIRVDGLMRSLESIPNSLAVAAISRIKILAGLDIAEKRRPQDGKFALRMGARNVDVRVSILPSSKGEGAVLRFLNRDDTSLTLADLGLSNDVEQRIRADLQHTSGVILVTGPTGSGKTTSLYSFLNLLNEDKRKLITLEDPVEYQLEGVHQVQVNSDIGFSFAEGLRSILRQDPDVVMVGEIRDAETAAIALQAALTGHLVFSTVHTNDAISTVERLLNLDVEEFLIRSAVLSVVAQRLVRRLCNGCKKSLPVAELPESQSDLLNTISASAVSFVAGPVGCQSCGYTGYKGRIAIVDYLNLSRMDKSKSLREQLDLLRVKNEGGISPLLRNGIDKVLSGETSLEEVLRVAI